MTNTKANIKLDAILKSMRQVAGWLWNRGWAEWGAGNISVNVTTINSWPQIQANDIPTLSTNQNLILLTSTSGSRMRHMIKNPENCLCLVNVDGHSNRTVISIKKQNTVPSPTSEFESHLLIHQTLLKHRPYHKAVLHTHPAEIIALSRISKIGGKDEINEQLRDVLPELSIYLPEGIAYIPFCEPGSIELAEASATAMEKFRVAIWEKHGIIATGSSLEEAFDAIDLVVKAARIWFLIRSVE